MLPEDLKEAIAKGPRYLAIGRWEPDREFVTRIAELAYQLGVERGREDERKECAKIANEAAEVAFAMYKGGGESYADGRCDEAFEIAEAIEARGKE